LKAAREKAQAKKGGARPGPDEVVAAFEGIEVQTPSGSVRLAIGKGHQGITDTAYGTFYFNKAEGKPELVDIVHYPAECVNPPGGRGLRCLAGRRNERCEVQLALDR
jgi:branched-chain amino acid transport system substrate-binding protein